MEAFEVAQALRRRRRAAGMSQVELARAMGTTQSSVSRAESGRVMPSVRFLQRYAWATGRMLSIDIGPAARMRAVILDPEPRPTAPERRDEALERLKRGEISHGEYALETILRELDLIEAGPEAV